MLNINIFDIVLIMAPMCLLLFLLQGEFKMSSLAGGWAACVHWEEVQQEQRPGGFTLQRPERGGRDSEELQPWENHTQLPCGLHQNVNVFTLYTVKLLMKKKTSYAASIPILNMILELNSINRNIFFFFLDIRFFTHQWGNESHRSTEQKYSFCGAADVSISFDTNDATILHLKV